MADAATFFANKKKKKKAFKFNANKIDASSVTHTVHVDAPALSTDNDAVGAVSSPAAVNDPAVADANENNEQWDDEALAATLTRKGTVHVPVNNTAELLDMKALDLKRSEQGDIAEKLRVEETRAKLAAAREGMEKEAQRLKEEKEKKEQEKQEAINKTRFGAAAAGTAGGGKWLPPHMRSGGVALGSRPGMGFSGSSKLDTEDENLFPDLAAADAILEKQKSQQPAFKAPKKTPVGGGATWGSRPKQETTTQGESPVKSEPEVEPKSEEPAVEKPEQLETTNSSPASETLPSPEAANSSSTTKEPIKPKKKKKKDLSTFKPSS